MYSRTNHNILSLGPEELKKNVFTYSYQTKSMFFYLFCFLFFASLICYYFLFVVDFGHFVDKKAIFACKIIAINDKNDS